MDIIKKEVNRNLIPDLTDIVNGYIGSDYMKKCRTPECKNSCKLIRRRKKNMHCESCIQRYNAYMKENEYDDW
jgi:hypothetical protein